jgi:alcohol dehydrogenase (cytochrome c)
MRSLLLLCGFACSLTSQVTYERIAASASEPASWLTYSGSYAGHRYSALAAINRANVARLKPAWIYQTNDLNQFEATPIVADGVMYISEPPSHAAALDLRTGRPIWMFRRTVPDDVKTCCGQVNRGVAVLGSTVFLGTLDAHLLALDAKTGHLLWDVTVADYKTGHSITAAPLALRDKVIVGVSGGSMAFAVSWTPTMPAAARGSGASGPCPPRVSPATTHGTATPGKPDRPQPG